MTDYALGTTVYIQFTTRAFSTGVPAQLAGTPAISVLEENNATPITSGITLNVDRASVTGLNEVAIVASSGNGYESGKEYAAYISTGTVSSTSVVGEVIGRFSIEKQSALRPTTAGRTLDVSAGGEAGIDWANIGSPTTAQNLSATNIDVDQVVASVSGAVGSVTGAVGSVAAGGITAASIATDAIDADALAADAVAEIADGVWDEDATGHQTQGTFGQAIGDPGADTDTIYALANSIQADTDDIQTRLPAALVGGRIDASVGAVAANAITAAAIATDAIDADALAADAVTEIQAGLSTVTTAQVNAEVVDALNVDTYAEIGQETPAATQTIRKMLAYLYKAWRNKSDQTSTLYQLYNDDAATVDQKATVSDDGTTFTKGEIATGP